MLELFEPLTRFSARFRVRTAFALPLGLAKAILLYIPSVPDPVSS